MRNNIIFLLTGLLILSFYLGCLGSDPSDITISKKSQPTNNDSTGVMTKGQKPKEPWSNASIWKSLVKSKTTASFPVKINDPLPSLTFRVNGAFKGKYFVPTNVEILDSSDGKIIQKLIAKGKFDNDGYGFSESDPDLIQFVDVNGDGYLDLRLQFETGATGNNWYATYIYQPKTKKFKYHNALSLLSSIKLDPDSKVIKTYWRGGWCAECREYFRLDKGDKLILDKIEWTEIDRIDTDSGCLKYTGEPRDIRASYLGYAFYNMDQSKYEKYIRSKVKIVSREELRGSLDGRARGPLGTPY